MVEKVEVFHLIFRFLRVHWSIVFKRMMLIVKNSGDENKVSSLFYWTKITFYLQPVLPELHKFKFCISPWLGSKIKMKLGFLRILIIHFQNSLFPKEFLEWIGYISSYLSKLNGGTSCWWAFPVYFSMKFSL